MRRRNVARVVAAGALALSLAACGADQYMEDLAVSQSGTDEEYQVRKNPLVEVDTAQDAAKGAGFDGFSDGAASLARLGDTYQEYFITSPGHCSAEIVYEGPNVDVAVHKGLRDAYELPEEYDDIFYDDGSEYAHTWTQEVGDVTLTCCGNREGAASKALWTKDGYDYVVYSFDLTFEDASYGLSEADLADLVPNVG